MRTSLFLTTIRRIIYLLLSPTLCLGSLALACPEGETMSQHSLAAMKITMDLGSQSRSLPALQVAETLLFGPNEELESPMNNALSLVDEAEPNRWTKAQELLARHLNRVETTLVLLEGKDDGRGFQPERGESTEINWVFSLVIPSLSDHIYWMVIPKKPQTPKSGYVYGFN